MDPIDLTQFAERVDAAYTDGLPMVVGTAGPQGPDVAFKGSLMVWDRDHLAWWERALGEQLEALRVDPRVVALYRKPGSPPLRFYGEARFVEGGELRDQVWDRTVEGEKQNDPERRGFAVLVRVDRVRHGRNVMQQRSL